MKMKMQMNMKSSEGDLFLCQLSKIQRSTLNPTPGHWHHNVLLIRLRSTAAHLSLAFRLLSNQYLVNTGSGPVSCHLPSGSRGTCGSVPAFMWSGTSAEEPSQGVEAHGEVGREQGRNLFPMIKPASYM